eukprot:TRINITY_DN3535_c0_g1_i1.p1 TRINITY_DN3535_c0_g1~~TRINITY_DN3535_c0_g1_i1.p1  ORF type:complete len:397 (-),score=167.93 TRINITY_DN3535_c0_g1_i1:247-1437(-)
MYQAGSAAKISSEATYYEILDVEKDATTALITKAYYRLARKYHPDKNPNDPSCEEKFKLISEAYQVLTDEEKRKRYDTYGKDSVEQNFVHPKEIFKMLFGGGKFESFFGEISLVDALFGIDDEGRNPDEFEANILLNDDEKEMLQQHRRQEELEKRKAARMELMVHKLIVRIEPFVNVKREDSLGAFAALSPFSPSTVVADATTECETFHAEMLREIARDLMEAPGGFELLDLISYIYIQEGEKNTGAFLGLPGFFTKVAEKGHLLKEGVELAGLALKLYQTSKKLQEQTQMIDGKEIPESDQQERSKIESELTGKLLEQGLQTMWRMGKFDIELAVRAACDQVLHEVRSLTKARARALERVGKVFREEVEKARKDQIKGFENKPFEQLNFAFQGQ